jgi:predicted short-subunit dehydrogenase-like oxidoreductase (DUF2520 family)
MPRIGFIGAGRLGTTVAMGFARAGLAVPAVASRSRASAAAFAARVPGCKVMEDPNAVVTASDIVFVTTPDDAIAHVGREVRWRAGVAAVHCSGATEIAALAPAQEAGGAIGGFHPGASFGDPDAALAALPGCMVAIEAAAPLRECLEALAQTLGCSFFHLPPGTRGVYHGAGGFTSQFINVLFNEGVTLWSRIGIDEANARAALLRMLKSTVAAIEKSGPVQSMPGPVSRGDVGTIRKHVEHLGRVGAEELALYTELCRRTVKMALAKGSIDAAKAAEIRAALGVKE